MHWALGLLEFSPLVVSDQPHSSLASISHGPLKKYVWGETDHSHTDPHAAPSH